MTTIEFLLAVCLVADIVLSWVRINQSRRILDALHTLTAQGNQRRQWVKQEREG